MKRELRIEPNKSRPLYVEGRRYGGMGVLSRPEPYCGPKAWTIEGNGRTFQVVRVDRSPTGSGHGAFRIDEKVKGRMVVRGYTCSTPDFEACRRVAIGL